MTLRSLLRGCVVGAVSLFAAGTAFPTAGHADQVFNIIANNIGVNCGASCGTVTVHEDTVDPTLYTFTVDLEASSGLVLHGSSGAGNATVAFSGLDNVTGPATSPPTTGTILTSIQMDGFGKFDNGVKCQITGSGSLCDTSGVSPADEFVFSIHADANGLVTTVALDIASPSLGKTGFAGIPGPIVGSGLPGLIAACGALMGLARRRRKKLA
jgi:hypothetical protein